MFLLSPKCGNYFSEWRKSCHFWRYEPESHIRHSLTHYNDVIMGTIASQITSLTIVYSTVYSGADQRKHQIYASPAFVRGNHRGPVNFPHKGPIKRKICLFSDVIMTIMCSESRVTVTGMAITGITQRLCQDFAQIDPVLQMIIDCR